MGGWELVGIILEGNAACLIAAGLVPLFHPELKFRDYFNLKPPWRFFLLWGALAFGLLGTNLINTMVAPSLIPGSVGILGPAILNIIGPFAFVSLVHYIREVLHMRTYRTRALAAIRIIFATLYHDGKVSRADVRNLIDVLNEREFFIDNDEYRDLLAEYQG